MEVEAAPLPSVAQLREVKNELIGSLQRKQSAFKEGLLSRMLTWVDSTENSEVLFQLVPSVVAIAKDVPEASAAVRLHSAGLLQAAQLLFTSPTPSFHKVSLRLLSLLISLEAVTDLDSALRILAVAMESRLLAPLSAETLSVGIKSGLFGSLAVEIYERAMIKLVEIAASGQNAQVLEPFLWVVAHGISHFPSLLVHTCEVEKLLCPLTRSSALPVKLASLRLATVLIQHQAASDSLVQTVTPTLAGLCLLLVPEACELLSAVARGNKPMQDILCKHNFPLVFAEIVVKASGKEGLVLGVACLAAVIDSSEDARLKVLSNDCFLGVVLNLLNIGDIDLLKSVLELLFSLSRSTRGLKPELLTETVAATLCQLLEHYDGKVKELVLKILCNTVLDYDSLQVDVTMLVSKTCKLVVLPATRELALWLLKNLTFIDKAELKQVIVEAIPLEEFVSWASNGTPGEQLQSLGLLRNVLYPDCKPIESSVLGCAPALFRLLEAALTTQFSEALLHSLYEVVNLSCAAAAGLESDAGGDRLAGAAGGRGEEGCE